MKCMNLSYLGASALALLAATASFADFTSITCSNSYQGVDNLSLAKRADGSGVYDLKMTRAGFEDAQTYSAGLACKNLAHSGAGTFVSLVNCVGEDGSNASRVVVGHSANVNWVDRDADGNLVQTATGAEVEFVISKPGQDFPFLVLTFSPDKCKQL